MICLFESSTCFKQLCAHPQEDNFIHTTPGIITLKTSEWSKITKITRIHRSCIAATMYSSSLSTFGGMKVAIFLDTASSRSGNSSPATLRVNTWMFLISYSCLRNPEKSLIPSGQRFFQ